MRFATVLFLAGILLPGIVHAQDGPFDKGCRLCLPFDKPVDGKFLDPATGMVCEATGKPPVQDGGVLASQFNVLSVPTLKLGDVADAITLSVWIAPAKQPTSYETLLFKGKRQGAGSQQIQFCLSLCEGRPELKFTDEQGRWKGILRNADTFTITGAKPVPLADVPAVEALRWNHVAATFDHGHVTLYINGEKTLAGPAGTERLVPNDCPLRIAEGQALSGHRAYIFTGLVSNVRLYDRALPPDEMQRLYSHERAGKPAGSLKIAQPLPEGYDPNFEKRLPITAEYEKHIPATTVTAENCRAAVAMHQGAPGLFIDGKPVYPMMFMPSVWVDTEQTFNASRDFAAAGVDLFSDMIATNLYGPCHDWWQGVGQYDFQQIDDRMGANHPGQPQRAHPHSPEARSAQRLVAQGPSRPYAHLFPRRPVQGTQELDQSGVEGMGGALFENAPRFRQARRIE